MITEQDFTAKLAELEAEHKANEEAIAKLATRQQYLEGAHAMCQTLMKIAGYAEGTTP